MIIVHHLNNSRSQRILWLLEELGLDYEIKKYERDLKTMLAPPELRAIHPLGKSPVITDGDTMVAESGAIIEYLIERYGKGRFIPAAGTPEKLRYTYFMHYAEGSAMTPLLMKLVFDKVASSPMPFFAKPIAKGIAHKVTSSYISPQIVQHLKYMESELATRDWFAGDELTGADFQVTFVLEAASARGGLGDKYPKLNAYLKRVHARPAYQRGLERGGPYALIK
jgi:glutathione S-transferase